MNLILLNVYVITSCFNIYQTLPTRENQTPSILDLILTKDENDIENVTILPSLGVSDHVVIKFDFLCSFKEHYTGKAKIKIQ